MTPRSPIPKSVETELLTASRRRCCVCVFLHDSNDARRGQIAHINRDPSDSRFDNLVWLCLEHHDEYDSRTSQSKGLTAGEVRRYRDQLYARNEYDSARATEAESVAAREQGLADLPELTVYQKLRRRPTQQRWVLPGAWRFSMYLVANQPDLFAYRARNGVDGICLIERIDLPDGRIVIACIEMAGNPGQSVTNSVETICFQVCERFDIPAERLVWLEHYDYIPAQWWLVTFERRPPTHFFEGPKWTPMTPPLWNQLHLRPKKAIPRRHGQLGSKIRKLFSWPTEALL